MTEITKQIEKAKKAGNEEEEHGLALELFGEQDRFDDKIASLTSQHLKEQAQRYLVPVPEFDTRGPAWVRNKTNGYWRLSTQEQANLRSAIRKERKERWELWQMRLTLLVGLGGMLIGLVSVLKK